MKFFFPDSQDQIDPGFDFVAEEYSQGRSRQHDDRYAHEILNARAYDGLLVSKSIVDGTRNGAGKYTLAQRHRLYRVGVERFFRLALGDGFRLIAMGDCGAFSYVGMETPPYTVDEVIDFYEGCGFDRGLSVDHVILGYANRAQTREPSLEDQRRRLLTLELANEFLRRCVARKVRFEPVGVAQGWDGASMANSVRELQAMGYRRIALGGMAALRTVDLLECLETVSVVRDDAVEFHLLGVTRCDHAEQFGNYGVSSFDSTSPFRQSFKDERDNYYVLDGTFTAIKVPQVSANPSLKKRILAGQVEQDAAINAERAALGALRAYSARKCTVEMAVSAVRSYEELHTPGIDRRTDYTRTLNARPWEDCACGLCSSAGIDMVIFRGAERNKRRGFHNLAVFARRLERSLKGSVAPMSMAAV